MRNVININKSRNYESCGSKCVESRISISVGSLLKSILLLVVAVESNVLKYARIRDRKHDRQNLPSLYLHDSRECRRVH